MIGLVQASGFGEGHEAELILASGSPRRADLLRQAGLAFRVQKPAVAELSGGISARDLCLQNAHLKAEEIAAQYRDDFVIGADTVVVLGGEVFGKPKNLAQGADFLRQLRGRVHEVMTGVALRHGEQKIDFVEVTYVKFRNFSDEVIARYHENVEVLDKAGGYALQEMGNWLVEKVEGDESNVVGLPVSQVVAHLRLMGFSFPPNHE